MSIQDSKSFINSIGKLTAELLSSEKDVTSDVSSDEIMSHISKNICFKCFLPSSIFSLHLSLHGSDFIGREIWMHTV